MFLSPLLPILRALTKERMRALEKFIRSPFHVTHPGALQLFLFLKENLNAGDLSKEKLEARLLGRREKRPAATVSP